MSSDAPTHCREGHRLGPGQVLVAFVHCGCDKTVGGGHATWTCRVCADVIISDGHTDDRQLHYPLPPLGDIHRIAAD